MSDMCLVEKVLRYTKGFDMALAESGASKDDFIAFLREENVEQCPNCKKWVDTQGMYNEDDVVDGFCEHCR